ncbi:MAG: PAS domain-containing protein [Planctomycetota bacterium]|nr:PAS domain-containing protein [Planctomycetota bacterium]
MDRSQFKPVSEGLDSVINGVSKMTDVLRLAFDKDMNLVSVNGSDPSNLSPRKMDTIRPLLALIRSGSETFLGSSLRGRTQKRTIIRHQTVRSKEVYIMLGALTGHSSRTAIEISLIEIGKVALNAFLKEQEVTFSSALSLLTRILSEDEELSEEDKLEKRLVEVFDELLNVSAVEGVYIRGGLNVPQIERWSFTPPARLYKLLSETAEEYKGEGTMVRALKYTVWRSDRLRRLRCAMADIGRGAQICVVYASTVCSSSINYFVTDAARMISLLFERAERFDDLKAERASVSQLLSFLPAHATIMSQKGDTFERIPITPKFPVFADRLDTSVIEGLEEESEQICRKVIEQRHMERKVYDIPGGEKLHAYFALFDSSNRSERRVIRLLVDKSGYSDLFRDVEFLADLVNSSSDGIMVIDSELRILFANSTAREMLNLGFTEFENEKVFVNSVFEPTEGWLSYLSWARDSSRKGTSLSCSHDSEVRYRGMLLDVRCSTIHSSARDRFLLSMSDITERRRELDELKQAKLVFDRIDDAVLYVDMDGVLTQFNAGASTMLGLQSSDQGRGLTELMKVRGENGEDFATLREKAAAQSFFNCRGTVNIPGFFYKHAFIRITSVEDLGEKSRKFVLIISDETESVRDRKRLKAIAQVIEHITSRGMHKRRLPSIVENLRKQLGLVRAVLVITSYMNRDGVEVFPKSLPMFLAKKAQANSSRILAPFFAGESVLSGPKARSLYTLLFNSKETFVAPADWIVRLRRSGSDIGLLMLWESESTIANAPFNRISLKTIGAEFAAFLEQMLLFEQEKRLRRLAVNVLQKTVSVLFVFDEIGRIRFCNSKFHDFFGSPVRRNVMRDEILQPPGMLVQSGIWKEILTSAEVSFSSRVLVKGGMREEFRWTVSRFASSEKEFSRSGLFVATGEDLSHVRKLASEQDTTGLASASSEAAREAGHFINNSLMKMAFSTLKLRKEDVDAERHLSDLDSEAAAIGKTVSGMFPLLKKLGCGAGLLRFRRVGGKRVFQGIERLQRTGTGKGTQCRRRHAWHPRPCRGRGLRGRAQLAGGHLWSSGRTGGGQREFLALALGRTAFSGSRSR